MNTEAIKELIKKQNGYAIDSTVYQEFEKEIKLHQVRDQRGNILVAGFPVDTSDTEMRMVAKILQGELVSYWGLVTYTIHGGPSLDKPHKSIGQKCIPGLVRNNTIIATYPELIGNYDIEQYNLSKAIAQTLGGRMENIVHTMWVLADNDD